MKSCCEMCDGVIYTHKSGGATTANEHLRKPLLPCTFVARRLSGLACSVFWDAFLLWLLKAAIWATLAGMSAQSGHSPQILLTLTRHCLIKYCRSLDAFCFSAPFSAQLSRQLCVKTVSASPTFMPLSKLLRCRLHVDDFMPCPAATWLAEECPFSSRQQIK